VAVAAFGGCRREVVADRRRGCRTPDLATDARDDGREVAVADRLLAIGGVDDRPVDLIELLAIA
jgi:hypothetical protein